MTLSPPQTQTVHVCVSVCVNERESEKRKRWPDVWLNTDAWVVATGLADGQGLRRSMITKVVRKRFVAKVYG